jgi:hypothetical protein
VINAVLMLIVTGVVVVALLVDVAALVGWLKTVTKRIL